MRLAVLLCLVCFLSLACCSKTTSISETTTSPRPVTTTAPSLLPTPTFEVVAWVSDPNPPVGSRVVLYGSLLKEGVYLGGMAMRATWPDENQERGMPNCSVQVIYGSGVCIVESAGFESSVYVPITVTFEYQHHFYHGQTGFTPR